MFTIMNKPSIAFVHDWLVDWGGAENVLSALLELFPAAPIYTLVYNQEGSCKTLVQGHQVYTSFLQKIPNAKKHYRSFLPLMPLAIEQFDLSSFDIIISSSHAVAKGVITGPDQLHICYIHSPIRYAWDLQHQYLREAGLVRGIKSVLARLFLHYIRNWDVGTANRVNSFVANSGFIKRRVMKVYHRSADVIYPPVDIDVFEECSDKDEYYLAASRMVPYKKLDIIIKAFRAMPDKKLIIVGDGPDRKKLESIKPPNVDMLGYLERKDLIDYLQRAKAFIFAAEEDFGILPVEAQACGTPVIAYGKGGALETVINGKTGLFFMEQSTENILTAILKFEDKEVFFSSTVIRENSIRFGKPRFKEQFLNFVNQEWEKFHNRTIHE